MVTTRAGEGGSNSNGSNGADLNCTLQTLQQTMEQMSEQIRGLLIFQQHVQNGGAMGAGMHTPNQGQIGRLTKLEFPKFYGDDVQGWLYRVNQFFLLDQIAENQKVRLVSMHMFDKALNWHKQFVKRHGENVEWALYEREVKIRFDSVFEDPMVELKNLKQVSTVQVYQDEFEVLMNKVELSEAYAISLFFWRSEA